MFQPIPEARNNLLPYSPTGLEPEGAEAAASSKAKDPTIPAVDTFAGDLPSPRKLSTPGSGLPSDEPTPRSQLLGKKSPPKTTDLLEQFLEPLFWAPHQVDQWFQEALSKGDITQKTVAATMNEVGLYLQDMGFFMVNPDGQRDPFGKETISTLASIMLDGAPVPAELILKATAFINSGTSPHDKFKRLTQSVGLAAAVESQRAAAAALEAAAKDAARIHFEDLAAPLPNLWSPEGMAAISAHLETKEPLGPDHQKYIEDLANGLMGADENDAPASLPGDQLSIEEIGILAAASGVPLDLIDPAQLANASVVINGAATLGDQRQALVEALVVLNQIAAGALDDVDPQTLEALRGLPGMPLGPQEYAQLGTAWADHPPLASTLWHEHGVSLLVSKARGQGTITTSDDAVISRLTEAVLGDGGAWGSEPVEAADLAALARDAGVPLEALAPLHVAAAALFINAAGSSQGRAERLSLALGALKTMSSGKLPELTPEEQLGLKGAIGLPLSEEELAQVGKAFGSRLPPIAFWQTQGVDLVAQRALEQGSLSDAERGAHGRLAETLIPSDMTSLDGVEIAAADLAVLARDAGLPLERIDGANLTLAAEWINKARTPSDFRNRVAKSLDVLASLSNEGGLPDLSDGDLERLPRAIKEDYILNLFPGSPLDNDQVEEAKDDKIDDAFTDIVNALENPGDYDFKIKLKDKWGLDFEVHGDGSLSAVDIEKKKGFWGRAFSFVRIAVTLGATAASFGAFAAAALPLRIASTALSTLQAIRQSNPFLALASLAKGAGIVGGDFFEAGSTQVPGLNFLGAKGLEIAQGISRVARGLAAVRDLTSEGFGMGSIIGSASNIAGGVGKFGGPWSEQLEQFYESMNYPTRIGRMIDAARNGSAFEALAAAARAP